MYDYELDIREDLLEAIETAVGPMDSLYLLSTQDLVQLANTLRLDY